MTARKPLNLDRIEEGLGLLSGATGADRGWYAIQIAAEVPALVAEVRALRAERDQLAAQLGEATVRAAARYGPAVELPERTAVPGEPLPPPPDSAYPAGATPLAAVDHRTIISRAHRHLIASGWRGDSLTPMGDAGTDYVLRRPGGRIEAHVSRTGKLTAVTLAGLSPEQIGDLARAVARTDGDR